MLLRAVLIFCLLLFVQPLASVASDGVERELASKLQKAGQWAAAFHGSLYDKEIRPFLLAAVQQLRGESTDRSRMTSLAADRSGDVGAGILLASVIKNLAEKRPALKESIELASSEGMNLNQEVVARFFGSLIKAVYEDSRFQIQSAEDIETLAANLSSITSAGYFSTLSAESFVSLFMKGLVASEKFSPVVKGRSTLSAERQFLQLAGVPDGLSVPVRKAIIKHLGERMDRVDYSAERAHEPDDDQREAVVQEIFDLAQLAFVPHQAEPIVSTEYRREVLSHMIRAFQTSETELSYLDINTAKLRVFPQDRIPDAQKFWERQVDFLLLQSNMEILSRLKSDFNRFSVKLYERLKGTASERILLPAQIPTVTGGMDLVVQMHIATHSWKDFEHLEDVSRDDLELFSRYLLRLWIERCQDLLEDRVAYVSDELLMVPQALKNLLSVFPNLEFAKGYRVTVKGIVNRLMRASVYLAFDQARSAEEILEKLWALDFDDVEIPGVFAPSDFKAIQRSLMSDLVYIFKDFHPTADQWASYALLYSADGFIPRFAQEELRGGPTREEINALILKHAAALPTLSERIHEKFFRHWTGLGVRGHRVLHFLRPASTYQQLVLGCRARVAGIKR